MDDPKLQNCWVVLTDCLNSDSVGRVNLTSAQFHVISAEPETGSSQDVSDLPEELQTETSEKQDEISAGNHGLKQLRKPPSLFRSHRKREQGAASTSSAFAKDHLFQKYGTSLLRKPSFCFEVTQTSCREITDTRVLSQLVLGAIDNGNTGKTQERSSDSKINLKDSTAIQPAPATAIEMDKDCVSRSQSVVIGTVCDKTCPSTIDRSESKIGDPPNDLPPDSENGSIPLCSRGGDKPDSASDVIFDDNQFYTNPSCEMPAVGLSVNVGLGRKLKPLQVRCVLTCLDDCITSISPQYAEFCSSVVKSTSESSDQNIIMPITDENVLDLMRIKWKARSVVKKVTSPSPLPSTLASNPVSVVVSPSLGCESTNNIEGQTNVPASANSGSGSNQLRKTNRRKQNLSIVNDYSEVVETTSETSPDFVVAEESEAGKASKKLQCPRKRAKLTLLGGQREKTLLKDATLEMERRQSVDSTSSSDNVKSNSTKPCVVTPQDNFNKKPPNVNDPQPPYDPDDIRRAEISEEILQEPAEFVRQKPSNNLVHELRRLNVAVFDVTNSVAPVICKFPDVCKLGCVCSSLLGKVVRDNCGLEECMFECSCTKPLSSRRESYTWVQKKARENLAKEERHFKQAVVRSDSDGLILVEGRRKRKIKVPERYREDIDSNVDLQVLRQFGARDSKDLEQKQSKVPRKRSLLCVPGGKEDNSKANRNGDYVDSVSEDSNVDDESLEMYDYGISARTEPLVYGKSTDRKKKHKQLLQDSSCDKVEIMNELKIISTQALDLEAWEKHQEKSVPNSDLDTCAFLFNPDFIDEKKDEVVLLPWTALSQDVNKKLIYLWIKAPRVRPKIFLTQTQEKPCEGCVELLSIEESSDVYENLPFHLKSLLSEDIPFDNNVKCVWITKFQKGHWMIVGYLQPDRQEICQTKEVDIVSSFDEETEYRWWVMDTREKFDLIYFIDFKKAMTKHQINTLVKLSNEDVEGEEKIHRILLNRRRPKIDPRPTPYPDFGAYSIPNHSSKVFIGPYNSSREPRFHVYSQKVAHNGRTEYEKIPLFYCGGGESVRVNSRGVLSLQSECPPKKYVKGTWYQSRGKEFRKTSDQSVPAISICEDEDEENVPLPATQILDLAEEVLMSYDEPASGISSAKRKSNFQSTTDKNCLEKERLPFPPEVADFEELQSKQKSRRSSLKTHFPRHSIKSNGVSVLKTLQARPSPPITNLTSKPPVSLPLWEEEKSDPINICDSGSQQPVLEYLVPSEREIGVVTITHLPSGIISVPHFLDASMLKFYHDKEEVMKDINHLIHHKLACLSKKCKVFLRPNEVCQCVTWIAFKTKEKCLKLPCFKPDIFNGFFMLTRFGLVDVRTADKGIISTLGKDWVEWLKNDEIRLKLNAWKREQIEITEKHYDLMRIITSNQKSDLSLLQVIGMATDEIAKLKAQDQLLDIENQTQTLLKETLIYSLCRKLNGFPGEVVPKFLQQLDLGLLWEVLECMDSRDTTVLEDTDAQRSLLKEQEECLNLHPDKGKIVVKNGTLITKKKIKKETKKIGQMKESWDRQRDDQKQKPLQEQSIQQNKDGLVCRVSPFARLNIHVGEGGIKCGPVSTTHHTTSPDQTEENWSSQINELQLSPVKPPNILRKNKNPQSVSAGSTSPVGTNSLKQARKQILLKNSDEEVPIFEENPELKKPSYLYVHKISSEGNQAGPSSISTGNGLSSPSVPKPNEEDPISSVKISSVVSDVAWDDDLPTPPSLKNVSSKTLFSSQNLSTHSLTVPSTAKISQREDSDPISSLKISSVYSSKTMSSKYPELRKALNVSNCDSDPISSVRISNVVSGGIPSVPQFSEGSTSTHQKLPLPLSVPLRRTLSQKVSVLPQSALNKTTPGKTVAPSILCQGIQKTSLPVKYSVLKTSQGLKLNPVSNKESLPSECVTQSKPLCSLKTSPLLKLLQKTNSGYSLTVPVTSLKVKPPNLNEEPVVSGNKSPEASNSSVSVPPQNNFSNDSELITGDIPSADNEAPIFNKDVE